MCYSHQRLRFALSINDVVPVFRGSNSVLLQATGLMREHYNAKEVVRNEVFI